MTIEVQDWSDFPYKLEDSRYISEGGPIIILTPSFTDSLAGEGLHLATDFRHANMFYRQLCELTQLLTEHHHELTEGLYLGGEASNAILDGIELAKAYLIIELSEMIGEAAGAGRPTMTDLPNILPASFDWKGCKPSDVSRLHYLRWRVGMSVEADQDFRLRLGLTRSLLSGRPLKAFCRLAVIDLLLGIGCVFIKLYQIPVDPESIIRYVGAIASLFYHSLPLEYRLLAEGPQADAA